MESPNTPTPNWHLLTNISAIGTQEGDCEDTSSILTDCEYELFTSPTANTN